MASNDYYNQNPYPTNYRPYNPPPPSAAAPPYTTHPPSRAGTTRTQRTQDITSPVSPFEAPFDDHVYPLHQPSRFESQSTLGQDTRYYGPQSGSGRLDGGGNYADDIPLRDHPATPAKDSPNISTDHVYDADPTIQAASLEEGRKGNGGSGLGRFGVKGRIAWVTYLLTTIQVIVFIVEIIKNGMSEQSKAT